MAKFKFPLQAALKQKKIREDVFQKHYQDCLAELHAREQRLVDLINLEKDARLRASQIEIRGGVEASASLKQIHDFIVLNLRRINKQKELIQEQQKLVEVKREILRQAAIEHKIMIRLKEKKFEEFKYEQDKLEQKELDEISVLRFAMNSEEK